MAVSVIWGQLFSGGLTFDDLIDKTWQGVIVAAVYASIAYRQSSRERRSQ